MSKLANTFNTLKMIPGKKDQYYYSLTAIEEQGICQISRLPVSIRIMLESLLRNCDEKKVKQEDIVRLAKWEGKGTKGGEVPFVVSRVLLQDFTGVPLLVDLAAMRNAVADKGYEAGMIEPEVPVDLVVDHSVQVDRSGTPDSYLLNLKLEFERNLERYSFLKWGQQAFKTFKVIPPGIGIVHQANLEYIASVITEKKVPEGSVLFPDTLVGTDSHTPMINGLGVVGWGVGGIEAEAAMLGQPVTLQIPEVIGVHLTGKLQEGVTGTDLALRLTEILRKENVVDKFVEFFGKGASSLTVADRSTIGNMAPEYGATIGFFPIDEKTLDYLRMTGRDESKIEQIREYLTLQKLFGMSGKGDLDFTKVVELDLSTVAPAVSGPKRPQDRINLPELKEKFQKLLKQPIAEGGYGKEKEAPEVPIHSKGNFSLQSHHDSGGVDEVSPTAAWDESEMVTNRPFTHATANPGYSKSHPCTAVLTHGSVVIAAITSCTNTSNPVVMVAAGLVAKKAVELGLNIDPKVKTSLAPGSRVVTEYLNRSGLQHYLDKLGFNLVGYGCTTCIGNSGPLDEKIEEAIKAYDVVAASVLSGNRNFEARIHSSVKANFLMSPPLVVAFAIAGRVDIDVEKDPLAFTKSGKPVFLKDLWPSSLEIDKVIADCLKPEMFKERYAHVLEDNPLWKEIKGAGGMTYGWDPKSTYIQHPPYFKDFTLQLPKRKELKGMQCLALFGDSVTTDHISPAGAFSSSSPAGAYLISQGIKEHDFNSYGSRRGNHNVMMRGTFANVRIKNKLAGGKEGGYTTLLPEGSVMSIFDACEAYRKKNTPLIIFAGKDYGMGSSRDWAAKGTSLLGVRAVVAQSFERIHRSNLIGMGVLPLEFKKGENYESLGISGQETFSILGLEEAISPKQEAALEITKDGKARKVALITRLDTPMEIEYYRHGGVMPFVLRKIVEDKTKR